MDDVAVVGGLFDKVAVGPDALEAVEVGGVVAAAVVIAPEAQRHRRERRGADQLAAPLAQGLAFVVVDLQIDAEDRHLQLAAVDRQGRGAADEAAQQVRPAGDRGDVQVGLHVLIEVVKALVDQG